MKQRYFLDKKFIPQLPKKGDKWVTADSKEKAVQMFAVRIAKTKFAAHIWKAKLPEIKNEISSYVYLMKKNEELSEMQQLSKELQDIINELTVKNFSDVPTTWNKMSSFQKKKILQYLGEPASDASKSFYNLKISQAEKVSKFIDNMRGSKN